LVVAGNTVARTADARSIGINGGQVTGNVVFDNDTGIANATSAAENRVYHNSTVGITDTTTVSDNVVYSNGIGIEDPQTATNNLVYANTVRGIYLQSLRGFSSANLINNTVYQTQGDAVRVESFTLNVHLRNNILWALAGADISVASDSETGFTSDFNDLVVAGGQAGNWEGVARPTLFAWQSATLDDQSSFSRDPLFVNPMRPDGKLGYVSPAADGRDDDFHEQSLYGSYHGGSLAPVTDPTGFHGGTAPVADLSLGLPVFPAAVVTKDAGQSPAIDRGAATDSFANEPTPNGNFINVGAYGNTAQASLSPAQYVLVLLPDGGQTWPEDQTFPVSWRSQNFTGTVDIDLLQGGSPVLNIAAGVPNTGKFVRSIPDTLTPGTNYQIRVTRDDGSGVSGTSATNFAIAAPVHVYYVNDGNVNATGDWTTAPGNDANDGLTPATPKATINGVLTAYHLRPGDVIKVDDGTYPVTANIILDAAFSGVTIEGYNDPAFPTRRALLNRGNTSVGAAVFEIHNPQAVGDFSPTLDHLAITGGTDGILGVLNGGSSGLTITNCTIFDNSQEGVFLQAGHLNVTLAGNTFYGQLAGVPVITQDTGIEVDGTGADVTGNTIYFANSRAIDLRGTGDFVSGNNIYRSGIAINAAADTSVYNNQIHDNFDGIVSGGLVTGNTVYGQSDAGIVNGLQVQGNIVHDNNNGIVTGGLTTRLQVVDNRVYGNTHAGIVTGGASTVQGNTIDDNAIGILASGSGVNGGGTLVNNLIYDNAAQGILLQGATINVVNNTVYQPTGDAVLVQFSSKNVNLRNNVFWTRAGNDVSVANDSQVGFQSDYNDLYATDAGHLGLWQGQTFDSLTNWFYEVGFDGHSISADPRFVNPAGVDQILGFSTVPVGTPQILEDSSAGFSATGSADYVTQTAGYNGTFLESQNTGTASWTVIVTVPAHSTRTFTVSAYWVPHRGLGTAVYSLNGGNFASVSQQTGAAGFHTLGTTTTASNSSNNPIQLTYTVGVSGSNIMADAVKLDDGTDPPVIVDDGDPGFAVTVGTWRHEGSGGDYTRLAAGAGAAATWTFTGLTPGATYQLAGTWTGNNTLSFASDFTVFDGTNPIRDIPVRQQMDPVGFAAGGVTWQPFGAFTPTSTTLTVTLTSEDGGSLFADAIRLQQILGDGAADDNFRLTEPSVTTVNGQPVTDPGSPAIDRGNPTDYFFGEPPPNGGCVDLGAYGNTAEAATSPQQLVQVLAPGGLNKVEDGEAVQVAWRSAGLTPQQPVALVNAGGGAIAGWSADTFSTGGETGTITQTVDTSGVTNPAPQAVYQDYAETVAFTKTPLSYHLNVPDGTYTVRLDFVDPDQFASVGHRKFDVNLQGLTVLPAFDIVADAGAPLKVTQKTFTVTAANGGGINLVLAGRPIPFSNNVFVAVLSGLEVYATNPVGVANPTVKLELSADGGVTWTPLANGASQLTMDQFGQGTFLWTVPANLPEGNRYEIRVTANDGTRPQGVSEPFQIANGGHDFYVNDNSTAGDVFTTAVGDDANSGKDPAHPMASLGALLAAYPLGPGDVVHVDTGTYNLDRNLVLTARDSGVTIEGPSTGTALFNRGNTSLGSYAFELQGATGVTLDHLSVTGGQAGIFADDNSGSTGLTVSNSVIFLNARYGVYVGVGDGHAALTGNTAYGATGGVQGIGLDVQSDDATVSDNIVYQANLHGIEVWGARSLVDNNKTYKNGTGIYGRGDGTISNNRAHDNNTDINGGGIDASSINSYLVTGNIVYGNTNGISGGTVQNNQVYGNSLIGIRFATTAQGNVVHDNATGISGNGLISGNRVYHNQQAGIVGSQIQGNQVYGNPIGIEVQSVTGAQVANNLIYESSTQALVVAASKSPEIVNNTVYQPAGDGIVIQQGSSGVYLHDYIIWVQAGNALSVSSDSQTGFQSDYNDIYATGTGQLALWQGQQFSVLSDWFYRVGQDGHSISVDPQFVNPAGADGVLGYDATGHVDDGVDDDFQLQPGSPAMDRGNPQDPFALEPAPNGGRVDLGAYGNTPQATASPSQLVQVLYPNQLEKLQQGQHVNVTWHTAGLASATFHIDLSGDDGVTWAPLTSQAFGLTVDTTGNGSFAWTVPANLAEGNQYLVRVTADAGTQPRAVSEQPFLVANGGHNYYINDASQTGDVFTAAVGNDANSGKDPAHPMATLAALLAAYHPHTGDTVFVDTGTYHLLHDVVFDASLSGVRIVGPASAAAVLERDNNTSVVFNVGRYAIELRQAVNVTLDHLSITAADAGIFAAAGAQSTGLTVSNCTIFGNNHQGIFLNSGNDGATLIGNTFFGVPGGNANDDQALGMDLESANDTVTGNTVFDHVSTFGGQGIGILVNGAGILVQGNTVFGNSTGIQGGLANTVTGNTVHDNQIVGILGTFQRSPLTGTLITGNTVYNQSAAGAVGIKSGNEVANNVVYANTVGIQDGLFIHNNRVYDNSDAGIAGAGQIIGNRVYSNAVGIRAVNSPFVADNLVYANINTAVSVAGNSFTTPTKVVNNTVYQPVGDALLLTNTNGNPNVFLRNNILWVESGFAIHVIGTPAKLDSDYNLLYTGTGGGAIVGLYGGTNRAGLADWQAATGQDAHSLNANPQFVDRDGADNLLGFAPVGGQFVDGGADDNFYLAANSPAIDSGYPWAVRNDQEGFPRRDDPGTPNTGSPDYFPTVLGSSQLAATGTKFFGFFVTLPFAFPFYGGSFTSIEVGQSGILLINPTGGGGVTLPTITQGVVAPLWGNWTFNGSQGDGIFVDTSVTGQATFRWQAHNPADGNPVNFAAVLFSDGHIRFDYGAGNTDLAAQVGIASGNGQAYVQVPGYDGQTTLTNALSVELDLRPGFTDMGAYEFRGSSLDTTPPAVVSTFPPVLGAGGSTGGAINQFRLNFSEDVNPNDANSPAVYELRKAGSNGFGSVDDVVYALTPRYIPGVPTATLDIGGLGGAGLPPGTYRLTVHSNANTTIHDLAGLRLDGDGDGTAGGDYVRTFTVVPATADLAVTQTPDKSAPLFGDTVHLTVTVQALSGPAAVTGIVIADALPAGLTPVNVAPGAGTYDNSSGTWSIDSLAVGSTATLVFTATVAVSNRTLTNTAALTFDDQGDTDPTDNSAAVSLAIPASADLAVTAAVDQPTPLEGGSVNYTFTVTNTAGPDTATGVSVAVPLPAGVSFQGVSADTGSYDNKSGAWTVGSLAPGAKATLSVSARVTAEASSTPINTTAAVTADQIDPVSANNSAAAAVTVGDGFLFLSAASGFVGEGPFSGAVAFLSDSDPGAQANYYTATIDWNDGKGPVAATLVPQAGGFNVIGSHALEEGQQSFKVVVTDRDGSKATDTGTFFVTDAALTPQGMTVYFNPGSTFTSQVASFTDGNANGTSGDFTATIDWGDHQSSGGTVQPDPHGGFDVLGTHTYASDANFGLSITIQDVGGSTTTATSTATITPSTNVPPTATIDLSPTAPTTNQTVTATVTPADADGDPVTLTYVWTKTVNGKTTTLRTVTATQSTTDTLDLSVAGNGDHGDIITLTVTPNDGFVDGAVASAAVTVADSAPVLDSVSINQAAPKTNDTLTVNVSSHDADGDSVSYGYQWFKNSNPIRGATGPTLDLSQAGHGERGDQITVQVTPSDGTLSGAAVVSAGVTVQDSPPVLDSVSISPNVPTPTSILTANVTSHDDDGDAVSYSYQWYQVASGSRVAIPNATGATLDLSAPGNGKLGETLTVQVTPHAAGSDGDPKIASPVTIPGVATTTDLGKFKSDHVIYGKEVVLTATVRTSAKGAGTPTGMVTFKDGAAILGSGMLSGGQASYKTTALTAGPHTITAVYDGAGDFATSTSAGKVLTVTRAAATVVVTASTNPSVYGQPATFSATIAPQYAGVPGGTADLVIDGHAVQTGALVVAGRVTFQPLSDLSITDAAHVSMLFGMTISINTPHIVQVVYHGDLNFTGSTGTLPGGQTVNLAGTTVMVSSSANPSVYGQPVTFTATVASASGTAVISHGSVQFVIDGNNFGTPVPLDPTGHADSAPYIFLTGKQHMVEADCSGNSNFRGSKSADMHQTVQAVAREADPLNATLTDLFVGTPPNSSHTEIELSGDQVVIDLHNGQPPVATPLAGLNALVVYGQGNNDHIQVDPHLTLAAFLFAGTGANVHIEGGGGPTVVVGGGSTSASPPWIFRPFAPSPPPSVSGPTVVVGGTGRNILIAGIGGSHLVGGPDDDLLIGGRTDFDLNLAALEVIAREWQRRDESFQQRLANLQNAPVVSSGRTTAPNGTYTSSYFLNSKTVHDNGVSDRLEVEGQGGLDAFFANLSGAHADQIVGRVNSDLEMLIR
jgi:uncharacterized repeat protein (TIGR01451 family)